MKSSASKFFSQLLVLIAVIGASTVISNPNVTTCSCYGFYNENKTWIESKRKCTNDGGHLVTMETVEEWTFINSEIQNRSTYLNEWHIGLKNESNEWKWVNNKSLTIQKWQRGEPSNDGKCVVMAKNYPNLSRGLWNDLPCELPRGFICEYDQESSKCNGSRMFCLQRSTERPVTNIICDTSHPDGDQSVNLVYVVIALGILLACGIVFYIYVFYCKDRNSGLLLRCKEYRSCEFKTTTCVQMEEGRARLTIEPTTETEIEDDRNKTNIEYAAVLENHVSKDDAVEDSVKPDYTTAENPPAPISAPYSRVNTEQKTAVENEDAALPKMPSPYRKAPDTAVVYATVDKSKKTDKEKGNTVEVVYAVVDKKTKRRNTKGNS